MLNDRVDPAIEILWVASKSLGTPSVNRYYDPLDGQEYDETDLTALEAGHVYLFKRDGENVRIHTPYRIVDAESAQLLQGLGSFWTLDPGITGKLSDSLRRKPSSARQDFQLKMRDFRAFQLEAMELGWVFEKDEVNVELLVRDTAALCGRVEDLSVAVGELRERYGGVGPADEEVLREALGLFGAKKTEMALQCTERMRLASQLDRLSREFGRSADFALAEVGMDDLLASMRMTEQLTFDRYERELIHRFRVNTGLESKNDTSHLRPLGQELKELGAYHPCMRFLTVEGKNLLLSIPGLTITVTPKSIQVTGDPGVLRPYLGTVAAEGGGVSRRFSAITAKKPSPPR